MFFNEATDFVVGAATGAFTGTTFKRVESTQPVVDPDFTWVRVPSVVTRPVVVTGAFAPARPITALVIADHLRNTTAVVVV